MPRHGVARAIGASDRVIQRTGRGDAKTVGLAPVKPSFWERWWDKLARSGPRPSGQRPTPASAAPSW
jgi:hypothetical protein